MSDLDHNDPHLHGASLGALKWMLAALLIFMGVGFYLTGCEPVFPRCARYASDSVRAFCAEWEER